MNLLTTKDDKMKTMLNEDKSTKISSDRTKRQKYKRMDHRTNQRSNKMSKLIYETFEKIKSLNFKRQHKIKEKKEEL